MLQRMAVNDYSVNVTGQYLGVFAAVAKAVNDVSARIQHVTGTLTNISNGDLSELEAISKPATAREGGRKMTPWCRP